MNAKLINEVYTLSKHMKQKYPHLREGQALMNALHEVHLECYESIFTTDADCFFVDDKIPAFWEAVSNYKA